MAVITNADLNAFMDECIRYYLKMLGTSGSGYGMGIKNGAWGAAGAATNLDTLLLSMTDTEPIAALIDQVRELRDRTDGATVASGYLTPPIGALQAHVVAQQITDVTDLESYLKRLNVLLGSKWGALQDPNWRDIWFNVSGGVYPEEYNLYFEVLQGATYPNALRKLVVGTGETAGFAIDSSKYAGGFPKLNVSGLTGSDTVTVTGTAYDPATMAVATSKTWTASVTGNGVVALAPGGGSPAPADSLIVAAGAIAAGAGITAGTIYVEAHRPAGRPLLP